MTLTNLKYCFSGSLTITEFVLLSLVILEELCILNRYVGDILNKIMTEDFNTEKYSNTKRLEEILIQERLMTRLHNSPHYK